MQGHRAHQFGKWVKDFLFCPPRHITLPFVLQLSRDSSQGPSLAVQCAAAFHLKNVALLADTTELSLVWEPKVSDNSFRQTPVRHRHISVYLWTFSVGRTLNCCGRDTKCLAECTKEREIVFVSAQLCPGCSNLANISVLNTRNAHRDSCTLRFRIYWEHQLSQKKKLL